MVVITYTTFTQFYAHIYVIIQIFTNSNQASNRPPDIMWCREPFIEVMNEIEDVIQLVVRDQSNLYVHYNYNCIIEIIIIICIQCS